MNYSEDIWSDLTWEEKQTYHIYEEFQKETVKRGSHIKWLPQATSKSSYIYDRDGKYPGDKIRESKNWKYFCDVREIFKESTTFEPKIFIESVFRHLPRSINITPAQLRTKKIIQQYRDYREKIKIGTNISEDKQIMQSFVQSYKYISMKINKSKLNFHDIHSFFNDTQDNNVMSQGLLVSMHQLISPYYLAISKSFQEAYEKTDEDIRQEIMDFETYSKIRTLMRLKTDVFKFAKRVFGDDII